MKKLIYSKEDLDLILVLNLEEKDKEIERLSKALLDIKETLLSETQAITPSYLRIYILDRIDEVLGSDKE